MAKTKPVAPAVQEVAVSVAPTTLRLPLGEARVHNAQFVPVAEDHVVAAAIALTAKGTNPTKARVYGYDNLADGGGVPKDKRVLLVAGFTGTPKGVSDAQWDRLVAAPSGTVLQLKDAGITSRTIRRAYRAGAIRFAI